MGGAFAVSEITGIKDAWVKSRNKGTAMFGIKAQAPEPKLEVYDPGIRSTLRKGRPLITFSPNGTDFRKLLGYTFSEAVDDLEGSFSFTIEEEKADSNGNSLFDKIKPLSVVKIYEMSNEIPVFVGIVRRRRISSTMTDRGVKRSIVFSGKSIISIVSEFCLSMDMRLVPPKSAQAASTSLTADLARPGIKISEYLQATWNAYQKMFASSDIANTGLVKMAEKFIDPELQIATIPNDSLIKHPIAMAWFNQGTNSLTELWRNILPQPVYEMFAYTTRNEGKPRIMVREAPFDAADWNNLDLYEIDPLDLIGYDVSQSDDEVYTYFFSYLLGSPMSREFYTTLAIAENDQDESIAVMKDKFAIYGFKPLEIDFRGYDRSANRQDKSDETKANLKAVFKKLNERAMNWYGRLDDMFSGTITLTTDFIGTEDGKNRNPRVGCRAKFLGGEFYIEAAQHSWNYGGTPTITLTVSRGMAYNGKEPKDASVIQGIGNEYKELE